MADRFQPLATLFLTVVVVFLTMSLVYFPSEAIEASIEGLNLFWEIVVPSLFPFFILSEIMLGLGIVHALGVLLEPLMRPLFNVPGAGAFALSMGLAAGYPMDAVITAKFRKNNMCTRVEGERLLAFTNTADPLFMFGAVAVGMFHNAGIGMLLALAHYIGAFLVGLLFRYYGREKEKYAESAEKRPNGNLFVRAYKELFRARKEDGRPFGRLLGDAVNDSIKTLLMIGGFIMFFNVIVKVLTLAGIFPLLSLPVYGLFTLLGIDLSLAPSFLSGIFEIDIGSAQAAAAKASFIEQLIVVSFIIGWSGLSVHAQVASVLTGSDIRILPYIVARLIHGVIAAAATVLLYHWEFGQKSAVSAFFPLSTSTMLEPFPSRWTVSVLLIKNWLLLLGGLVLLSLALYWIKHVSTIKAKEK
ncbi:sporulation integral membrane protein YlbJ [Bacillaceae bacterium]